MSAEYAGRDGFGPTADDYEGSVSNRPNLAGELDTLDHALERLQKAIHVMIDKIQPVLGPDSGIRAVDPDLKEDRKYSLLVEQIRLRRQTVDMMTETLAQTHDRIEL